MSQNTTTEVVSIAVQARVPFLMWGPPGAGKTKSVEALAAALGMHCETVIASIREPSDFSGLPVILSGDVVMAPPAWAKRLQAAPKGGLLFLDEVSTAAPAVQAALLRVVLDRVVGDLALPDTVAIGAAANPPEQAAGGWELSAPLANRFCHLEWQVNSERWIDGMLQGWPAPTPRRLAKDWEATIINTRMLVASFIKVRPAFLLDVPKDASQAGRAWASARTWDMAARLLAAADSVSASEDTKAAALAGCIGTGKAMEFLGWLRDLDLPDPEALLKNPETFKLPQRGDQQFATLAAVATAVIRDLTDSRWQAAWRVFALASKQGAKDVAAAAVRALVQAGTKNANLTLPINDLKPFTPLMRAAGLMK